MGARGGVAGSSTDVEHAGMGVSGVAPGRPGRVVIRWAMAVSTL
jgi:hypothetical protein